MCSSDLTDPTEIGHYVRDQIATLQATLTQAMTGLHGQVTTEREQALRDAITERGSMPRGAAWMLGEDAEALTAQLTEWLAEVEDPELDTRPRGLVLPHLDYHRGWPLYASGYRSLQGMDAPDRVVILGTNHFGIGDGVVGTQWTWETPLGTVPRDEALCAAMSERLGKGVLADEIDHTPPADRPVDARNSPRRLAGIDLPRPVVLDLATAEDATQEAASPPEIPTASSEA